MSILPLSSGYLFGFTESKTILRQLNGKHCLLGHKPQIQKTLLLMLIKSTSFELHTKSLAIRFAKKAKDLPISSLNFFH